MVSSIAPRKTSKLIVAALLLHYQWRIT